MGLMCALRSYCTKRVIGLCLTASHNAEDDNGIKISDPDGGVIDMKWEPYCNELANAPSGEVSKVLQSIVDKENIDISTTAECIKGGPVFPTVFLARDTRASGLKLAEHAREAAILLKANVVDFGQLTTPQLHYSTRMFNRGAKSHFMESGYFFVLANAYQDMVSTGDSKAAKTPVIVDCANGIGGLKLTPLRNALGDSLEINGRNQSGGKLNFECGADFVYRNQMPPKGIDPKKDAGQRLASFDGDADRIVYHYFDAEGKWHLLDGDKLAVLFAMFLFEECKTLQLIGEGVDDPITFGCVQTAYANGASTKFLKGLGMTVESAKTGVKYVHHKAMHYDIGVYFEANGHGTVLFKDSLVERLDAMDSTGLSSRAAVALQRVRAATKMINQGVGDAISDLLFAEAILFLTNMTVQKWDILYTNMHSRQSAVQVKDRTKIQTTWDEQQATGPDGLQDKVEEAIAKFGGRAQARCFVRPSGTEDVVRVYAEAQSQEAADGLAHEVCCAVFSLADGVGKPPVSAATT